MKIKSQSALLVSCCDKLHNATCIIEDHRSIGKKVWGICATPIQISWYYLELVKLLQNTLKDIILLLKDTRIPSRIVKRAKR